MYKSITTYLDCNTNNVYSGQNQTSTYNPYMTIQSTYVVKCHCYESMFTTPIAKEFSAYDTFYLLLGTQRWDIDPFIVVNDASKINQVTDWALADQTVGKICFSLDLNNEFLLSDISGLTSKEYCMQIWGQTFNNIPFIISSGNVTIKNVSVEI